MGSKSNNAAAAAAENNTKRPDGTKIFLLTFAIIALVGVIAAIVIGAVAYARKQPVDYMEDNLGKYIKLSKDDYKSFDVLINIDKITDMSVENEIIKLLYAHRKETDNKNKIDQTVKVGDTVNLYYYGYTLDSDGNKVPFEGGSNFSESKITSLGIGSGNMIPGFELALIGKNSADYSKLTKRTSGVVNDDSIVYITYSALYYDGTSTTDASMAVDLSQDVDAKYGEGFKDYLIGATVGKQISDAFTADRYVNGVMKSDVYSEVTVNSVIEFSDGEPLTIDVTFPRPYTSSAELEGKSVKFDIYIATSVSYDTPEFNDEFITETLKVTEADLAEYDVEGGLVEKYKAKIRAELEEKYSESVESAIENAFWANVAEKMEIKRLPQADVDYFYRQYYKEIESYFNTYSSYYTSFDQAARGYLGIGSSESWEDALIERAESSVKDKLAFYYIVRSENLIPTGEKYQQLYDEYYENILNTYLEQYNINREDFDTDEEYEEKVNYYRGVIDSQYSESYIRENVYFDYAMEKLRTYASVKYAQ